MWPVFFSVLSAASCILSILAAIYAVRRVIREPESRELRLHSVESRLVSLQTSQNDLSVELEALAQRVKMQRVRNATNHASRVNGSPDPYQDPDRWRQEMNRQLAFGKLPRT